MTTTFQVPDWNKDGDTDMFADKYIRDPLIWTSKGNLPISVLDYSHAWDDRPDAVVFSETYKLGDEVVKHAVHVLSKTGVTGQAVANPLGA